MDNRQQAEVAIEASVRNLIDGVGHMADGKSLEWHGADIEQFSACVLRVLASGQKWDEQIAEIRQLRDAHIVQPISQALINYRADDVAAEFDADDRVQRARFEDFQRYGVMA